MKILWLLHLVEWFLGIQFRRENLNYRLENLASVAAILIFTALIVIYSPLLSTIDNMITSLNTQWVYQFALSSFKTSFITTPIHLCIVCLFKDVKNQLVKFKNIFVMLMVGFVGAYVMISVMQIIPKTIPSETLGILWLYPLITVAIVRLSISHEMRR